MTHYGSADDSEFEDSVLQAGDTFDVNDGYRYRVVERIGADEPFMTFSPLPPYDCLIVEVIDPDGVVGYQVADFSGDWVGCSPIGSTPMQAAIFAMMRYGEIIDHRQA